MVANAQALQNSTLDMNAADAGAVAFNQSSTLGGLTGSRNLDLGGTTLSVGNNAASTTYSGTLSSGALTKVGSGQLSLARANSYTGGTVLSAGTLSFVTGGLGSSGNVQPGGGVLRWESGNTQDLSARVTLVSGGTASFDTNGNDVTFASGFGGSTNSAVAKLGLGTLKMSGSNAYTGGTLIAAGRVLAANEYALGTGPITLAGGTLVNGVPGTEGEVINQGSGGTVNVSGGNVIHTFTTVGTTNLTLPEATSAQVLVVGGGGGGGQRIGGGGGAGGVVYAANYTLTAGTKAVTIGDGGAGATANSTLGVNGDNSVFDVAGGSGFTLIANGGGGGSSYNRQPGTGATGGSGGGGSYYGGTPGPGGLASSGTWTGVTGVTGYGNTGGASMTGSGGYGGGGGGGAGAVGGIGTSGSAGKGGVGIQFSQFAGLVASTVGTLNDGWFGGGGGAGAYSGTAGSGGNGGGGNGLAGQNMGVSSSGLANTGGGGGGGSDNGGGTQSTGGKGGSGIVIVSYPAIYGGGTLTLTGSIQVASTSTLDDVGGEIVVQSTMAGVGGIIKSGTGTVTLSAANTFSGNTTVSAGSLLLGNAQALGKSTFAGGAGGLSFGGLTAATFGGLTGNSALALSNTSSAAVALSVGGNDTSTTYSGVLTGAGSLAKVGTGRLTLTGSAGHGGATTVSAGILEIGAAGRLDATSGLSINGGNFKYNAATAFNRPLTFTQGTISGTGTIATAVTIGSGATLSPGNSPGIQPYTSGHAWAPGGTYEWELNALSGTAGVNWDMISVTGGLSLSDLLVGNTFNLNLITLTGSNTAGLLDTGYVPGSTLAFSIATFDSLSVPGGFSTLAGSDLTSLFTINLAGWQGTKPNVNDISVKVSETGTAINLVVVPEPTTLALAGIGSALLAWRVLRRRA